MVRQEYARIYVHIHTDARTRARTYAYTHAQGYADFDSGAAKKFVIDPHNMTGKVQRAG